MKYVIWLLLTLLLGGGVAVVDLPQLRAEIATIQMRSDGYFLYAAITEIISLAKATFWISILLFTISAILSLSKRREKE